MVQFYSWLVWKIARPLDWPPIIVRLFLLATVFLIIPLAEPGGAYDYLYLKIALWYGGSLAAVILALAWFFAREEFQRPSRLDDWLLSREKEKKEAVSSRRINYSDSAGESMVKERPNHKMEERYCRSCGAVASIGDSFCSSCGSSLSKTRSEISSVSFLERTRKAVPAWLFGLVIVAATIPAFWAFLEYYFSDGQPRRIHWILAAAMYLGGTLSAAILFGIVAGGLAWFFWSTLDD